MQWSLLEHWLSILKKFWHIGKVVLVKTGYLSQFDLYLRKKENLEENIGKKCCSRPNRMSLKCILYNLFNIFFIYCKAFWQSCICSWDFSKNRKIMPETIATKSMKRGDHTFWSSRKVSCCKWFDNQTVIMLFNNVGGMTDNHINHSTIPKRISIKISSIIPRCY